MYNAIYYNGALGWFYENLKHNENYLLISIYIYTFENKHNNYCTILKGIIYDKNVFFKFQILNFILRVPNNILAKYIDYLYEINNKICIR